LKQDHRKNMSEMDYVKYYLPENGKFNGLFKKKDIK
jgi:hypothetical protein